MSEDNKKKLSEQLIRCILDDKLSTDKKLKKMDYIIKMGADVNIKNEFGCSVLNIAKFIGDEKIVSFLEEKGAKETGLDREKTEEFFRTASVEEINKALDMLPNGYELNCNVDLSYRELKELPDFSKVVVRGNFYCIDNLLETLKGAPKEVHGDFNCCGNCLESLEYGPEIVGDVFSCSKNKLKSLKWAPIDVGSCFYCIQNQLETLDGAPEKVNGDFCCSGNKLTSLEGGPKMVEGCYFCENNCLTTLKGAPVKVGSDFRCYNNQLENLEGGPIEVGGYYNCSENKLCSLKGKPKIVDKFFVCDENVNSLGNVLKNIKNWFEM